MLDVQNIFLILTAVFNLLLGLIIYFNKIKESKLNAAFIFLALNVSAWSFSMFLFRVSSPLYETLALKVLYTIPIFIPVLFLYFTAYFLKGDIARTSILPKIFLGIYAVVLAAITFASGLFVYDVIPVDFGEKNIEFGSLYFLYIAHFIVFFGSSFILLLRKYFIMEKSAVKDRISLVFWGTFISSSIGMVTNLILPWFGYFSLNWTGNIATVFFVSFLLYAILKHGLFRLRVVATEVFALILITALIIEIFFVESTQELVIKSSAIVLVSILVYLLIRSVYKEIEIREQIEDLALDLSKANERLRELDQQKTEFVSIASHQLRSPLTAIKGYASLLLEGSYGDLSEKLKNPVAKIYESIRNLVDIVEDFLDVTRIEQGRMRYNFKNINIEEIVEDVIDGFSPIVNEGARRIKLRTDGNKDYEAPVDSGKIRQVIDNIIDNATKYSKEGDITVKLSRDDSGNKILISISDEGIGIPKDFIKDAFDKFTRGKNGVRRHSNGSGIGLFIAKEIIKAHKGRIWVVSEGENKGSTFFIELPMLANASNS